MTAEALHSFRWIVVNSSGGKDSTAALLHVVALCREHGVPLERVVVSHQCLGESEWKGTLRLVKEHCEILGLRLEVSSYRDKSGVYRTLLDYVRARKKWPSSTTRYCTSEFKRGPGGRVLRKLRKESGLCNESGGHILNVYGFRADESPARARKKPMATNPRFSTASHNVIDWLPIHSWTVQQVFAAIEQGGLMLHPAYALGMPRLSCVFCIFAPKSALILAGRENPELLDKYCEVEAEIGHAFTKSFSLASIRDAIKAGAAAEAVQDWKM